MVGGNFFDFVPGRGDAYLLKGVIHDWPDEDAAKILQNIRRVIPPDGTLLLIENIVASGRRPVGPIELLMLVIGGCERTESEFRSILSTSGFGISRIIPMEMSSVVECSPI
jgi:SAM-dependent methyltransferase